MSMGPPLGILGAMRSPSRFKQLCYWAFALLLITVRSADAHVHLCLDGQEPPAALHVADGGVHHDSAEAQQGHQDKDVKYAVDGTFKKADAGDVLLIATAWSFVATLPARTAEPPQHWEATHAPSDPFHLRPPLRGPPRFLHRRI